MLSLPLEVKFGIFDLPSLGYMPATLFSTEDFALARRCLFASAEN